jgi:hypothetical protein
MPILSLVEKAMFSLVCCAISSSKEELLQHFNLINLKADLRNNVKEKRC